MLASSCIPHHSGNYGTLSDSSQ